MLCNYILLTTGWMRLKAIFCVVASFSSEIHANLCKHTFFWMDVIFPPADPRQSFPMFSFQNQHILVYKHQFGCYSSGAAFFLSCEQIPSKCIRRVKLTPHQTYQHDFLTATFASDPVATAYIYKHNMQFNTKKSSSLAL